MDILLKHLKLIMYNLIGREEFIVQFSSRCYRRIQWRISPYTRSEVTVA